MVGEASHFQVPYSSQDGKQHMNLDCLDSEFETANAACSGTYQTDDNRKVEIQCKITLGAASGPCCLTNFKGLAGPPSDEIVYEYAHPKGAPDTGPAHLQSWEQKYRSYLNLTDPITTSTPELEISPATGMPTTTGSIMVAVPESESTTPSPVAMAEITPEKMKELQALMSSLFGRAGAPAQDPPKTEACAPTYYKCQVTKQNILSPPSLLTEAAADITSGPCLPDTICSTWKFARKYVLQEFSKKLTKGDFQPDTFKSDEGGLWSKEGASLWNDVQQLATDNQALGEKFMSRLVYRRELDLLTQTRFLRLELRDGSVRLFRYVLGLGIPGVLLTAVYMTLNMRTWFMSRKRNRLRKLVQKKCDDEIL